jgi:hypothetical protein
MLGGIGTIHPSGEKEIGAPHAGNEAILRFAAPPSVPAR